MDDSSISATPAPWQQVALVCGKCSRKLRGGFGRKGKRDLAEVIKDAAKATGRRRAVRVLEVGCLGLCPKRAVSAIGMGQPGQVLVVPAGTDGMLVLTRLLGDQPSPAPTRQTPAGLNPFRHRQTRGKNQRRFRCRPVTGSGRGCCHRWTGWRSHVNTGSTKAGRHRLLQRTALPYQI